MEGIPAVSQLAFFAYGVRCANDGIRARPNLELATAGT